MILAVLDSSALLALLLDEPGGEKVRSVLAGSALSTVNLTEVVGHYVRNGAAESDVRMVLQGLPIELVGFDADLAFTAALLVPATRPAGLSISDRACLALALRFGVPALTADRAWQRVGKAVEVAIELIR